VSGGNRDCRVVQDDLLDGVADVAPVEPIGNVRDRHRYYSAFHVGDLVMLMFPAQKRLYEINADCVRGTVPLWLEQLDLLSKWRTKGEIGDVRAGANRTGHLASLIYCVYGCYSARVCFDPDALDFRGNAPCARVIGNVANNACTGTNQRVLANTYSRNDSRARPHESEPPDFYVASNTTTNGDMGPFRYPAVVVNRGASIDHR
jgi:hypothetical protein